MERGLSAIEVRLRARGGVTLRVGMRVFWGLVAAAGILLLIGPVISKPLDVDDILAAASVDEVDWVARDAEIDYTVERAEGGAFTASVSEAYTADFRNGPVGDVERTIVTESPGHDVRFALNSATIDGEPAAVNPGDPRCEKAPQSHENSVDGVSGLTPSRA